MAIGCRVECDENLMLFQAQKVAVATGRVWEARSDGLVEVPLSVYFHVPARLCQ